jgi:N-acetylmuramoyl-L-alanine amidase
LLPKGRKHGRPGYKMTATSVTVHDTANAKAGADAEAHAKYLEGGRGLSWHFTVDADSIVQHLPIDEQGWHTGTNAGNTTSIGVEVCEYPDTPDGRARRARAEDNAAWFVARLLHENKSLARVVTHKSWSGKNCPRVLLPRWDGFLAAVARYQGETSAAPKPPAKPAPRPAPRPRMPLVRRGSRGNAVRTLQTELRRQGGYMIEVDGVFGKETRAAVRAWQGRKGIRVDGVVGTITWGTLGYR